MAEQGNQWVLAQGVPPDRQITHLDCLPEEFSQWLAQVAFLAGQNAPKCLDQIPGLCWSSYRRLPVRIDFLVILKAMHYLSALKKRNHRFSALATIFRTQQNNDRSAELVSSRTAPSRPLQSQSVSRMPLNTSFLSIRPARLQKRRLNQRQSGKQKFGQLVIAPVADTDRLVNTLEV